jgi:hypothetical protein
MVSILKIGKQSPDVYPLIYFTLLDAQCSISIYCSYCVWSCLRRFYFSKMLTFFLGVLCLLHCSHDLFLLIPQLRPAHKYPIFPWEMIRLPRGDNAVCSVKLLPLPQPRLRACMDARKNPNAQRATQIMHYTG